MTTDKELEDRARELLATAIRAELDRHLIDANDATTHAEYQFKAGTNKGLRDAGRILSRCLNRGDFDNTFHEMFGHEKGED